ncbi:FxLYD domain-containing protein [Halobacillus shinanisalinarum]|uniref:FxLYD domain-containing protein n=1 Tax=Halobacillus shinanisalinarum TaxID=2932258 RepID=A0ABY4GYD9_9BACI|nr:FxLYD domain-containing protein [Halobacillus shinanisalinarum]UOQ92940.1 FxLYD domain-containing protein [Halobacillus shinanisalinarum]
MYEKNINETTASIKKEAEQAALKGEYEKAESMLSKAAKKRPEFEALQRDLTSVRSVLVMNNDLNKVVEYVKDNRLEEAQTSLSAIQKQISNEQNRLSATLIPKAENLATKITIGEINNQIKQLTNIEELAEKLSALSGLDLKEAAKARNKINEKIVAISTKKAEASMKEKQFNEAIATVDEGLQYVVNNEKLIQLKKRVKQEQQAFEQQQQERIKHAMEKAAEEDLKNQKHAVKVLEIKATKDEFGDVKITGEVGSEATKIVSSVEVTFEIKDKEDEVLKKGKAQIYPMYLSPGDKGKFEKNYYELEGDVTVEVTDIEWYVE